VLKHLKVACAAGVIVALSASAIAFAAIAHPTLISPKGKVAPGHIKLVVKASGASRVYPVYVQIEPKRKIGKYGLLKTCTSSAHGCAFVQLKKGKHGDWSYKAPTEIFSGWWAQTPGKYYWQAQFVDKLCRFPGCYNRSKIGSFTVK